MSATSSSESNSIMDSSNSENPCRVVSLIHLSPFDKYLLSVLGSGFTIYGVDHTDAMLWLHHDIDATFPCQYGCATPFDSIKGVVDHINGMHAAELWKACDQDEDSWYFKEQAFPLVFACPFRCGASDLQDPDSVKTHSWVFHTSKPEEQEPVPEDDLNAAMVEVLNDEMELGADAFRLYCEMYGPPVKRSRRM